MISFLCTFYFRECMLSMVVVKYLFSFDFCAGQKEFFHTGNIVYMLVVLTPLTDISTFCFLCYICTYLVHPFFHLYNNITKYTCVYKLYGWITGIFLLGFGVWFNFSWFHIYIKGYGLWKLMINFKTLFW